MKHVLLDTNIVISAFLWGGTPRQVIAAAIEAGILLLTSDEILVEIERTLSKEKLYNQLRLVRKSPSEIAFEYSRLTILVSPLPIPEGVVRDSKDKIILASATGGKADAIVTGDKDLLTLKEYEGISIVTPAQFLAILPPPSLKSADDTKSE
jgi:putative PIN family toxin of toxin-antitoxin system